MIMSSNWSPFSNTLTEILYAILTVTDHNKLDAHLLIVYAINLLIFGELFVVYFSANSRSLLRVFPNFLCSHQPCSQTS